MDSVIPHLDPRSRLPRGDRGVSKRTVIISDAHCGHNIGLVPPPWHDKVDDPELATAQIGLYDFYRAAIKLLNPIDLLAHNGDAVDGRGERSGSLEILRVNRFVQQSMFVYAVGEANATDILMTIGTGYHVGSLEQFERPIAEQLDAKIGGHEWATVGGVTFDFKHKVGSSQIPHGRSTAVKRERLWNLIWAERKNNPKSDVIVRSHVHYFDYSGARDYLAVVTPALQGQGSRYSTLDCSGTVDFGLLWFDTYAGAIVDWGWILADYELQKTEALVI